jgi:hypothetical protein
MQHTSLVRMVDSTRHFHEKFGRPSRWKRPAIHVMPESWPINSRMEK